MQIYKYDGLSRIDFGRWKTKMLAVAAIKGGFDAAYISDLPAVKDLSAVPPITEDDAKANAKKRALAWNYLIVA